MIVPMKKIHLVVGNNHAEGALERLRALGVLHIEHLAEFKGHPLAEQKEEINRMERVIGILARVKPRPPQENCSNVREKCSEVAQMFHEMERLKDSLAKRILRISKWEPWGNFDPEDIRKLIEHKVFIELFEVPVAELDKIPENTCFQIIHQEDGIARCVVVLRENIVLPFERVNLPPMSLEEERGIQEEEQAKVDDLEVKVKGAAKYLDCFKESLADCYDELRFQEVKIGMKEEEPLRILKGFCPVDGIESLRTKAREEGWGLLVEEVGAEDTPPTLIRNPRWVEFIRPVFTMINIVPGYRELDISLFFLMFFSVFFGILIGDAAYGLIFLGLTIFAHRKLKNKLDDPSPFFLMYILSSCAVIWGALTGTFFGTVFFGKILRPLVGWLTNNQNVQLLCFTIGVVHLTIAHLWRALVKWGSFSAFAEVGWALVLWGAFFKANEMILGIPLMGFVGYIFLGGLVFIIIDILIGPKANIGTGLILLVFSIISAFTDVVSYVRLFAVGLAGVAVADAFNQMALDVGFNNVLTGLGSALILIFGHLLNITLCVMGVLVHGIRLNVLEFSGHLGMEWSGFKYDPFRRTKALKT